ncbi:MAG: hypothetical protein JRH08_05965 [Deltaproteobacteria bacterium]|nr:hypothetical protein [Deltaproteobacteria bacterium]MBW1927855.1 hypothetical protein [Deltaproteobacteria bacterium]MBW2026208.1 hypothetical protein [Deltaproteobacteria bacterium]MBW2125241.1 hypothetical protein [Deltaproteobacteria bacterium]
MKLVQFIDKRRKKGENFGVYPRNEKGHTVKTGWEHVSPSGRSAEETAKILDTSDRKAKEARKNFSNNFNYFRYPTFLVGNKVYSTTQQIQLTH